VTPEDFMRLALAEAEKGRGRTHPNPVVGAVVVRNGRVVARGHHEKAGLPHAEVNALRSAGAKARGADLYVTLEPCNHTGRTPPCTEAILAAGVRRVFFGSPDPNPLVDGHGGRRLARAGVEVHGGVLRKECDRSNEGWIKFIITGLPWVVLKAAVTLDGKLAGGHGPSARSSGGLRHASHVAPSARSSGGLRHASQVGPISGPKARALVHEWRDQLDAILVGAGTVRADDPRLTVRGIKSGRNPVRVVLGMPPPGARLLRERGETVVAKGPLKSVLRDLAKRGLTSVLVEGGARVHGEFLRTGLWDELRLFIAPKIFGAGALSWAGLDEARDLDLRTVERIGDDVLLTLRPRRR
jgi:diaminohydroxyphosphoribosylaminopyrimidine deaminase/5-amino-6-(5-phosphoribosylamino)uracil reductase